MPRAWFTSWAPNNHWIWRLAGRYGPARGFSGGVSRKKEFQVESRKQAIAEQAGPTLVPSTELGCSAERKQDQSGSSLRPSVSSSWRVLAMLPAQHPLHADDRLTLLSRWQQLPLTARGIHVVTCLACVCFFATTGFADAV